jgi:preprotein translocase subunit SecB
VSAELKKSSRTSPDPKYTAFLKGIKLLGFGMLESRTSQNRDVYVELSEKGQLSRKISAEYQTLEVKKQYFNASAKLGLRISDKAERTPAVIVECTYIAHFHCDGAQITKELADRFTESELRLVVWPYFRQFVNDATSRMAIQPVVMPFSAVS